MSSIEEQKNIAKSTLLVLEGIKANLENQLRMVDEDIKDEKIKLQGLAIQAEYDKNQNYRD